MEFRIYENGSFDLLAGERRLVSAYPAVDGIPVRPLCVKVSENTARYELVDGALEICIAREGEGLALRCRVEGLESAHDIMPIGDACVEGCDRAFVQGLGLGGPSGFYKLSEETTSNSLIAVGGERACVVVYAKDQSRLHNVYHIRSGRLSAGFDTECVALNADELPVLYICAGDEFSAALRACAQEIAREMHARPVTEPAFHWCSWYYLYHTLDQATLEEYLEGFKKHRDIAPFSHIQIDAGYFYSCGDWLDPYDRFPKGLKYAADTIRAAGYEPGIWIGPFMVGDNSRLFREHPDWMLRDADGGYVRPWIQYRRCLSQSSARQSIVRLSTNLLV